MKTIFSVLVLISLIGCKPKEPDYTSMTPAERLNMFREMAAPAVRRALTNDVVGLHAIISLDMDTVPEAVIKWRAYTTVEYVNKSGGIERTNLQYIFHTDEIVRPSVYASIDYDYYTKQSLAEMRKRISDK